MKSVLVVGHNGKMGQEISVILSEKKIELVKFKKNETTSNKLVRPNVVIDFSSPQGFDQALKVAIDKKIPLISGTTGLSDNQKKELKKAAKKIPVLWSANMSIGIAILKQALSVLKDLDGFDFIIEEKHHRFKKDKPSGTALSLKDTFERKTNKKIKEIHSIRAGGIFGEHSFMSASGDEIITFNHIALNRKVFAAGAVAAAAWIQGRKPGLYTMEDLINSK